MDGIDEADLDATLNVIKDLISRANLSLNSIQTVPIIYSSNLKSKLTKYICQVKIELDSAMEHFSMLNLGSRDEKRVAFLGASGSGKTTLLSVLSDWGSLDDGRGKMRCRLLHHRHELLSGSTSSVTHQPLVYPNNTDCNNSNSINEYSPLALTDDSIMLQLERRSQILNNAQVVQLIDSAGKLRFDGTVFSVLTSTTNFAFLVIEAPSLNLNTSGAIINNNDPYTLETLNLLTSLNIPHALILSKIDLSSTELISKLLEKLAEIVSQVEGKKKKRLEIYDDSLDIEGVLPVLLTSAVSGDFLDNLSQFITSKITSSSSNTTNNNNNNNMLLHAQESAASVLIIEQVVNLVHVGPVVYGQVLFGSISVNDEMVLGPQDHQNSIKIRVKSIQRLKYPVNVAHQSQHVSLALQFISSSTSTSTQIRKGMAIICLKPSSTLALKPLRRIIAEMEQISGSNTSQSKFTGTLFVMGQKFPAILHVQPRGPTSRRNSPLDTSTSNQLVCLLNFSEKRPATVFLFPRAPIVFIGNGKREKFAGRVIDYFA